MVLYKLEKKHCQYDKRKNKTEHTNVVPDVNNLLGCVLSLIFTFFFYMRLKAKNITEKEE